MIRLDHVTMRLGPEPLLEGADLTLNPGHRVGLVGANGSGKSTLFSLLRGQLAADVGEVAVPGHWVVAHMAQEVDALDRPAVDFVLDGDEELRAAERVVAEAERRGAGEAIARAHMRYENAGGYSARARAAELLDGLGFPAAVHESPVAAFSGGWRVRLALAQALMCPSDLLLLDEPTNHLDLEAVLWLEQWLRGYRGTLMLISHDRDFLDAVADTIVHIEHRKLNTYRGGYSDFERRRAEALAHHQAMYEKQQREVAHLQKFIDRFRAQANKARAAQSRIKTLERMERLAPAHVDSPFDFAFATPERAPNPMIRFRGVALGYGNTRVVRDVTLSLRPGARIGLLGPNGAGKSTLIRALAGEQPVMAGEAERGRGLAVGYFAQHQLEQLDADASPLVHMRRLAPDAADQRLRNFLGGFAFRGDLATGPVGPLSGGEKARLVLAMLVWQRPNLLLLDEPTNHLDLEMRHALTLALQGYEGAVVTVSHDRHLLNSTVDEFWLVADGGVGGFDGDLGDYRRWLSDRSRAAPTAGAGATVGLERASAAATDPQDEGRAVSAGERKRQRREEAERRQALRPLRARVEQLVAEIESVNARLAEMETRLADPDLYQESAADTLARLLQEQGALRRRHDELESAWMAAESELEAAEAGA